MSFTVLLYLYGGALASDPARRAVSCSQGTTPAVGAFRACREAPKAPLASWAMGKTSAALVSHYCTSSFYMSSNWPSRYLLTLLSIGRTLGSAS